MKLAIKIFLTITIFTLISFAESRAQSDLELGMRFGNRIAVDATIPLSKAPRFHPTIYFTDGFGVGTYFDWLFALDGGPTGLKFFPGLGTEFFFGDNFDLGLAGNFGMEYSFDFPLTVGIDYRPGFLVTDGFKGYFDNWGIVARFRFVKAH